MKKILIFVLFILLFILVGCHESPPLEINSNHQETLGNQTDEHRTSDADDGGDENGGAKQTLNEELPNESISIRSIDELNAMRSMLSCTDQEALANYLMDIEGGGAHSKEDLETFIRIVDTVPFVNLLDDGKICWISYSKGQSSASGEQYEILYVSIQSDSGEWVRFEYMLSVTDVSEKITSQTEMLADNLITSKPIFNHDERLALYSEVREKHVSGTGDTIKWVATVDGIYTNIVYYTPNAARININDFQISTLK